MNSNDVELMEQMAAALDDKGWSFLTPVLADGSTGEQIDSIDVAMAIIDYMTRISTGGE